MTSDQGFKRCDGYVGSVPQNFINNNLPICPMCGSPEPYWLLKDKMEMWGHRILFRCSKCGCIISATQDDFTGATKSTAYSVLTTGGAINAIRKKNQGKDVKTVYMKVEDAGIARTTKELEGQELPIENFQAMAASFAPVNDPYQPMQVSYEQAPPMQDIPMQVSYEQAPAMNQPPQDTPFQVSYQTPPAIPYQSAPAYTTPRTAPAKRFPVGSLILASLSAFFFLLSFIIFPAGTLSEWLSFLPFAALIVGLILYRNETVSSILVSCSMFVWALSSLISLSNLMDGISILIILYFAISFILIGLHYILKGKVFGNTLKLILSIVTASLTGIAALINIYAVANFYTYYTALIWSSLLSGAAGILRQISIIKYSPFKKTR